MTLHNKYLVIMPVRVEADYLGRTLTCLVNQTVLPVECILVDDGSTDATPEVIRSFAERFPWLHGFQRANRGARQRGAGVVQAFYDGMAKVKDPSWDFVVKLNADLAFPPFYFEELLQRFAQAPPSRDTNTCNKQVSTAWRKRFNWACAKCAASCLPRPCFKSRWRQRLRISLSSSAKW